MLTLRMPGQSHAGPLPPLTEFEQALQQRLERHIRALSVDIGERNVWRPKALASASNYIEAALAEHGRVDAQEYEVGHQTVRNLAIERLGATNPDEIVIVGAHYDTVVDCPGANDNASGVAALIELVGLTRDRQRARTMRFIAFVNEEPPFFQTDLMGSRQYSRRCRERGEKIVAMLSLETIGCFSDRPGSQQYPFPFSRFYPDVGNFVGFVGNTASSRLVQQVVGSFRRHVAFPSEGIAAPGWITGVSWSDQWSFWQESYPALMVTDTAPFRYPYYHTPDDTIDKVNLDGLTRVTSGLALVLIDLCVTGG
jgi:hypothetical protein